MIDSERYKLLYGPYEQPKCRVGDMLTCEYRGREVKVQGMTDALIPWPCVRARVNRSPILCGELIRAVRVESEIAVAHHWGVGKKTVWKWRRALEVLRMTPGSRRLRIDLAAETLTPQVRAKAKAAMHSPEVRAKLSMVRAGRPLHPNTIAAAREAARRPKSEEWKRGMSERSRRMWEHPEEHGLPARHVWTEEENALLGTDTDAAIARILGLNQYAVFAQRRRLGIARIPRRWTDAEIALLGTATDSEVARKVRRKTSAVKGKRELLGIPPFQVPWTKAEIALLGTASDPAVARRLGKTASAVQAQRERRGIPAFIARWTQAEVALLGTDTDSAIAELLGRTTEAVRIHRKRLRIPAYR